MFHRVLESHDGKGLGADSEEKHEPASDVDTVVVDSLKALDPNRPIREATKVRCSKVFSSSMQRPDLGYQEADSACSKAGPTISTISLALAKTSSVRAYKSVHVRGKFFFDIFFGLPDSPGCRDGARLHV